MRRLIPLTVFLLCCKQGDASWIPCFQLDYAASNATHVVVVDRHGRIRESWKGDLNVGQFLPVHAFNIPESLPVDYESYTGQKSLYKNRPRYVGGGRRALFLIRRGKNIRDPKTWRPSVNPIWKNVAEMKIATVWLQDGHAFAYFQVSNPGKLRLLPIGDRRTIRSIKRTSFADDDSFNKEVYRRSFMTKANLKRDVLKLSEITEQLQRIQAEKDSSKRAASLLKIIDPQYRMHQVQILKLLPNCLPDALPVFRNALRDEKYLSIHHKLIEMCEEFPYDIQPELESIIAMEAEAWRKERRSTHKRLYPSLKILNQLGYRPPIEVIRLVKEQAAADPFTGSANLLNRMEVNAEPTNLSVEFKPIDYVKDIPQAGDVRMPDVWLKPTFQTDVFRFGISIETGSWLNKRQKVSDLDNKLASTTRFQHRTKDNDQIRLYGIHPSERFRSYVNHVFAWDCDWEYWTTPMEEFNRFLKSDGFNRELEYRRHEGRIKESDVFIGIRRFMKAVVQAPEKDDLYHQSMLQQLEIVPQTDPRSVKLGDSLSFQVTFARHPLHNAPIVAFVEDAKTTHRLNATTDESGLVWFPVNNFGHWMIRAGFIRTCDKLSSLDYELFWSTLTLQIDDRRIK